MNDEETCDCESCRNGHEAFVARMREIISESGHGVMTVHDDAHDAAQPFTYTIGLTLRGLPELLMVGPNPNEAFRFVNLVARIQPYDGLRSEEMFLASVSGSDAKHPVYVSEIEDRETKDRFTRQVGVVLGVDDWRVQHLIAPDRQGRFPWDEGCEEPYRSWWNQMSTRVTS